MLDRLSATVLASERLKKEKSVKEKAAFSQTDLSFFLRNFLNEIKKNRENINETTNP